MRVNVLIIALNGYYRRSLEALLITVPQIGIIRTLEEIHLLTNLMVEFRPDIVFIDADELGKYIKKIKEQFPEVECVILADQLNVPMTKDLGGSAFVLDKNITAGKFLRFMQEMFSDMNSKPEPIINSAVSEYMGETGVIMAE